MKYIAVFDIPDDYVMGCACGKMCPNDDKVRSDKDFENVYAHIEQLSGEQKAVYEKYEAFDRIISDLGIKNAYDAPSFWCNGGQDYKVINTKYNQGYQQALQDIEKAVRKHIGFVEENNIVIPPLF